MPTPEDTQDRHSKHITGMTGAFKDELSRIVNRAKRAVIALLAPELDLDPGRRVRPTAANLRALRGIDKKFRDEMKRSGYDSLVKSFINTFPGQIPYFTETLESITDRLKHPLPKLKFTSETRRYLASQQVSTQRSLSNIVSNVARAAENKALATVGGVSFDDLVEILSDQFDITIGQAEGLAATSMATYWRTLNAAAFAQIEADLPEGVKAQYRYVGPKDKLTRPFCRQHTNKVRSREEWEALDNGQIPNPFLTGGGYRCRHHLILHKVQ